MDDFINGGASAINLKPEIVHDDDDDYNVTMMVMMLISSFLETEKDCEKSFVTKSLKSFTLKG
jgi:hypothetical protein